MKLKGKVAVVTGGSGGIGSVVVEHLAREGAIVVVFSRHKSAGKQRSLEIVCDVSNFSAVERAIKNVLKRFKKIDILVNCAGIQAPIGPFVEDDIKAWKANIATNLFGTAHTCKAVIPFMIKKKSGVIINFSGGGSTSSRPNFSAYAVAKTGVVKLTEILADELAPYRIRVNAVSPGGVNTNMLREVLKAGARVGKTELAASKKRAKEGGVPPELAAELVVFLASDVSVGITGRLVSAPWDGWKQWARKDIKKIASSDALKLRRA
jgi:3-oxoacyl-[acyl-carrier protein] reductase